MNELRFTVNGEIRTATPGTTVPTWAPPPAATPAPPPAVAPPPASGSGAAGSPNWAAPAAPQPVITIKFAQATDIDFVLVTTGAAADYANLARPKDIRINYGSGAQEEMQLKDDPKATCYGLHGRQEKSAAIRVLSVYPSPQGTAVAIAELEFFRFG